MSLLTKMLAPIKINRRANELAQLKSELEQVRRDRDTLSVTLQARIDDHLRDEKRLNERFREIARLTQLLQDRDRVAADNRAQNDWLRRVIMVLTMGYSKSPRARLAGLLPTFITDLRRKSLLKHKGLFDPNAYISFNPDVSSANVDPLRHFVNHGMREGRPSGQKV